MTAKEKLLKDDVAEQIETESKGRKAYKEFLQERFTPEQIEDAKQAERTAQGMLHLAELIQKSIREGKETLSVPFDEFKQYAAKYKDLIEAAERTQKELADLEPFIQAELDDYAAKHPDADKIGFNDLLEQIDIIGKPYTQFSKDVLAAARKRRTSQAIIEGQKAAREKAAKADEAGLLKSIGHRLLLPSTKEYRKAFTAIDTPAEKCGIFEIPKGGKPRAVTEIDTGFLSFLAKKFELDAVNGEMEIYFPTIAAELGLNLSKYEGEGVEEEKLEGTKGIVAARAKYVFSKMAELENLWGVLPTEPDKYYKLITTNVYSPKAETLKIASPYFSKLIADNLKKEQAKITEGEKFYIWQCDLLHSTAVAERNQAAVEMAARILQGVQQRGTMPDAAAQKNSGKRYKDKDLITYKISFRGLIGDCTQLRNKLRKQKTKSGQTTTLQRALKNMYKILREKSDLFTYYTDLKITEILPTMSAIDDEIIITHHGRNPDYKRPQLLLPEAKTEPQEQVQEVQETIAYTQESAVNGVSREL